MASAMKQRKNRPKDVMTQAVRQNIMVRIQNLVHRREEFVTTVESEELDVTVEFNINLDQREELHVVKVGGITVLVFSLQKFDVARLRSALKKHGLPVDLIERISTFIKTALEKRDNRIPAMPVADKLGKSASSGSLQINVVGRGLLAKDVLAPESGQMQVVAAPAGDRKPPNKCPDKIDEGVLNKLVRCVQQYLESKGYEVRYCKDGVSPQCLVAVRNSDEYPLIVTASDVECGYGFAMVPFSKLESTTNAGSKYMICNIVMRYTHCINVKCKLHSDEHYYQFGFRSGAVA